MARYHTSAAYPTARLCDFRCTDNYGDCTRDHVHVFTDAELESHDDAVAVEQYRLFGGR